jgi:hypothetical protein
MDERTGHIEALAFTKNNVKDSPMVEEQPNQVDRPIVHVSAERWGESARKRNQDIIDEVLQKQLCTVSNN